MKNLLFLLLATILNFQAIAQTSVNEDSIRSESEMGSIAFSSAYVPSEEMSMSEPMNNYTFKKGNDLFIRFYLQKPLVEFLQPLSKAQSVDFLVSNGNYQFTFLVDGEKIYQENLNAGAGTLESKSEWLTFMVPFISKEKIDSWGKFLWNRFLSNGGRAALNNGTHELTIEARPYLQDAEIILGDLIATGSITYHSPIKRVKHKLIEVQKINTSTEFQLADEKIEGTTIEDLNKSIVTKDFKEITSIVVLKHGKIALEEYFNGAKRKTLHDTRSVGKTVVGMLLGIAIQEGHIQSVELTLGNFYPINEFKNFDPAKSMISIKDLLTMSSGLEGFDFDQDSPGQEENMYPTTDWVKFALDLPMDENLSIGKDWRYFTAGSVLLGDILDKSIPGGLEKFAAEKLFAPLNITKYKWQYTPTGVVNTAGGLKLSSLDLAKIGQLFNSKGNWNGQVILEEKWVENSMSKHIDIPFLENEYYGYQIWEKSFDIKNKSYECFYASGNGGNKIFFFKDLPIVIVITAQAYNEAFMHNQVDEIMKDYLLKAIGKI